MDHLCFHVRCTSTGQFGLCEIFCIGLRIYLRVSSAWRASGKMGGGAGAEPGGSSFDPNLAKFRAAALTETWDVLRGCCPISFHRSCAASLRIANTNNAPPSVVCRVSPSCAMSTKSRLARTASYARTLRRDGSTVRSLAHFPRDRLRYFPRDAVRKRLTQRQAVDVVIHLARYE
jgi:hypothetical protein